MADLFSQLGVAVVDTDVISHTLTDIGGYAMPLIRADFGDDVCLPNGALNRGMMRNLVFSDPIARQRLEAILHPQILEQTRQALSAVDAPYSLLVVPLLFETTLFLPLTQRSLVVDCDESEQLSRIMTRDGITAKQAREIIAAQSSRQERLAKADDVIVNNGDLEMLAKQVHQKHEAYLQLFC